MPPREPLRAVEATLRCDHCGRVVRETQHTRTDYTVDYYSLYSGHGEISAFVGEDGQRIGSYVKLFDRFDVISCVDCYAQPTVQAELERRFRPERGESAAQGDR
jgi:hypothetical protein